MSASVFTPHRFSQLFASDTRNITRDPTLLFAIVFSIAPAVAGWFFRDAIDVSVAGQFGIEQIFEKIVPVFLCLPAFMIGWVTGFLFLEDRDDGPLLALDVTPIGKRGFMSYRIAVTAVITFALTLIGCVLLLSGSDAALILVISLMVALEAVGIAMIYPAIARNKVEGLALVKVTNLVAMASLVALIPGVWRFAGVFLPTFWVGETVLNAPGFPAPIFIFDAVAGIGVHLIVVFVLYRLQAHRAG